MLKKGLYFLFAAIIISILSYLIFNYLNFAQVSFDSNGGTNISAMKVTKNNTIANLPTPTKVGYKFLYWVSDGKIYGINTQVKSNMQLKAVWEALADTRTNKFEIRFDTDSDFKIESQTIESGNFVIKPASPIKENYIFIEWQLDGKPYSFNTKVEKAFTLKAVYESAKTYKVTFNANGGTNVDLIAVKENTAVEKPINPMKYGYAFKEWQLNGKAYDFNSKVTSDITLEAIYERNNTTLEGEIVLNVSTIDETAQSRNIVLSYNSIPTVTKYEIYRKAFNDYDYSLYTTTTNLSFNTNVGFGYDYLYKVRGALEENGKTYYSAFSNYVEIDNKLEAPNLSKSFMGVNAETLMPWYNISVDSLNNTSGMEIYLSNVVDNSYRLIDTTNNNNYQYESQNGLRYFYKVRLYKKYGDEIVYSPFSNTVTIFDQLMPPVLTSQFIGANLETTNYLLSVDSLQNTSGVLLYYKKEGDGEYIPLPRIYEKEYSAILTAGVDYTFQAQLFFVSGDYLVCSPLSNEVIIEQ